MRTTFRSLSFFCACLAVALRTDAASLDPAAGGARREPVRAAPTIPSGPEAPVWVRLASAYNASMRDLLLADLDRHADDDAGLRERTRALVERLAAHYSELPAAGTADSLRAESEALLQAGAVHPLLWYGLGTLHQEAGDLAEAKRWYLLFAANTLDRTEWSHFRKALVCSRLAAIYKSHRFIHEDLQRVWSYRAFSEMKRALAEDPACSNASPQLIRRVVVSPGPWVFERPNQPLAELVSGTPGVSPWLTAMLEGDTARAKAWESRGSGFADTVTPAGWEGFRTQIAAARRHFARAWELRPDLPEAATEMIGVAMADPRDASGPETRVWFERAVRAQMDHMPAYAKYAWSLRPRWGGSCADLHAFGRACLETRRFDTEVPAFFFTVLRDLESEESNRDLWWRKAGSYERLQELWQGYLHAGPPEKSAHYRTMLIASAWRCGRDDEAAQLLSEYGAELSDASLRTQFGLDAASLRESIAARTMPWRRELESLDRKAARSPAEALTDLQMLAAGPHAADPRFVASLQERKRGIEAALAYARGEWVELIPAQSLDLWRTRSGQWSIDSNRFIVGKSSDQGLRLDYSARFPGPMTVEFEVEPVGAVYGDKLNSGVALGSATETDRSVSLLVHHNQQTVDFGPGFDYRAKRTGKIAPLATITSVRFELNGQELSAAVNGREIFTGSRIGLDVPVGDLTLSLGGKYWYADSIVRFRKLRLRSLSATGGN